MNFTGMIPQKNPSERNVALKDLPDCLRKDHPDFPPSPAPQPEKGPWVWKVDHTPSRLYALLDMARIHLKGGDFYKEVLAKIRFFSHTPLVDDNPKYEVLKPYAAWLVYGNDAALLDKLGGCDSDIVSAWLISEIEPRELIAHFKQATFIYDAKDKAFLLRYHDPLITPVLHRLADPAWVKWFFGPFIAWWYPVSSPTQESWSRIAGGGQAQSHAKVKHVLTEELEDAVYKDPLPYHILNTSEQQHPPAVFEGCCYGVRLAKVEDLLEKGRKHGLKTSEDLTTYVLTLLETPEIEKDERWQAALRKTVAGQAPLQPIEQTIRD